MRPGRGVEARRGPASFVLGGGGVKALRGCEGVGPGGKRMVLHVVSILSASRLSVCYVGRMIPTSPEAIAASLTAAQREIVLNGPMSFSEADAIPEDLFEEDLVWDRETGDENYFWRATELGRGVRDLLEAQRVRKAR